MMPPLEDEEDALSVPRRPKTPIFTEVPWVIPGMFNFQLDKLDIHYKPLTDSPSSPDSTEVV